MGDQNGSPGGDSAINRKHQAKIERHFNNYQARLQGRNEDDCSSSFSESTTTFVSRFSELRSSISSQISLMKQSPANFSKPDLDAVTASIADLDKYVAENSYHLPSYDVRASLKSISDLKESLDELSTQMFPRKKFSFRNRPTKQIPVNSESRTEPEKPQPEPCVITDTLIRDSPGLRNRESEVLAENFKGKEVGEFTLSNLTSCEVRLIGSARTIFVNRLRACKIYCGPVLGSILIDEAEGCVFVVASHQIRIHNAKNCDFYLRVRSRPIIEDCSGVRFAPYCLRYEGIEEDLKGSNLNEETGNWGNVDDFKWLRAVQSPNWSILPEDERIGDLLVHDYEE